MLAARQHRDVVEAAGQLLDAEARVGRADVREQPRLGMGQRLQSAAGVGRHGREDTRVVCRQRGGGGNERSSKTVPVAFKLSWPFVTTARSPL